MPWHLSEDLQRFRRITWGKSILMGRCTYEAIGRPLPGRHNIVLTRSPGFQAEECTVAHSLDEGLSLARSETLIVIGGATLYEKTLPIAERLYLTLIEADYPGDTFFPAWNRDEWREIAREERKAHGGFPHSYQFVILERVTRLLPLVPESDDQPGRR